MTKPNKPYDSTPRIDPIIQGQYPGTVNPYKYGGWQKSPTVTFNINNFLTNGPMDL